MADLVEANGTPQGNVLWWSLALGADLGGNATAIGASANVVVLGLAERAGKRISFWEFSKYGVVVTVITQSPDDDVKLQLSKYRFDVADIVRRS